MYYPPYEAAAQAGIGSAMCSYNKINGEYACASNKTLNRDLREIMGFDGFVMSDFGAVHSSPKDYLPNGCDQEEGRIIYFNENATKADLASGELTMAQLNQTAHRVAKTFIRFGLYDGPLPDNFAGNVTSKEHFDIALKGVEKSTILLKNKFGKALPLKKREGMSILVLGNDAGDPVISGGGSGTVHVNYIYPPLWALCDEFGIDRIANGSHVVRKCNEKTGSCITYVGTARTKDHVIRGQREEATEEEIEAIFENELKEHKNHKFDATIIFTGQDTAETQDRADISWNQEVFGYLKKIKYPGTVVGASVASGPIDMRNMTEWADAILFNIMPGQKYSEGILNVIFGRANPEAKTSFTFGKTWDDYNFTQAQWPGLNDSMESYYTEKHHFGYRHFDQNKVDVVFPFGHGLSYTKFIHENLKIEGTTVSLEVKNVGEWAGSEIVQLYLAVPETENFTGGYRSPKVLKQFAKVKDLKPGQSTKVSMKLNDRAFSYWSVKDTKWIVEKGTYGVMVGASSRDIRLMGHIHI